MDNGNLIMDNEHDCPLFNGIMYFVVQRYVRGTLKVPRTLITNEL